ncbi:3534_t:CDS:2 [Funneliformis geosporum]|uniref:DNA-directed DNA polymerase n=1 Tax=Funneliformis geosporum TaxID=1117311 RepID=A0A9W4WVM2_9GLOM|nr:3534_t:CDS:2 [Funneliformis geosporum]
MAIENEGLTERINKMYYYVLRLYGCLINGQKALVTLINIQVFFDILVLDGETPDKCKEKTQSQELGEFAKVLDLNYDVFMISIILYWKDDPKSLKQICLVDVEIEPDPHWITIICRNQVNLLKAFSLCWRAFVLISMLGLTIQTMIGAKSENDFVKKYTVKTPKKGEEDLEEKEYIGGPIKIKIMCLKKRFPHSEVEKESSLKFFLQKFGLDKLLVNESIINDYREVASIAYVSLFDIHYHANEMKVWNLLSVCAKRDMVISTIVFKDIKKGKYPDAYIFSPKKGIITERPVTGLDFASLYFNIIIAYNLSSEKIILDREKADNVCKNGNKLHMIEFKFNKHDV